MRILSVGVLALLAVLTARAASAQSAPPQRPGTDPNAPTRVLSQRPYRGVFGGGVSNTEQLLTLGLNLGGGYDTSVLVDNTPVDSADPLSLQRTGTKFGQGSATVNYSLSRGPFSLGASGGGAASYYPVSRDPLVGQYFGSVSGGISLGMRASVSGAYSIAFQPAQHLLTPGVIDPTLGPVNPFDSRLGTSAERYRSEGSDLSFSYQLHRRQSVGGGYSYWRSRSASRDRDASNHQVSASTSFQIRRGVSVYVAYRTGWSNFNSALMLPAYRSQNVDFGLNFSKALSLTNRTSLSFGTGAVGVTDGQQTRYALTGNVRLGYDIGRTWTAAAGYARDASFVQTFQQPVFTDAISANVSGFITRRLRFDAGSGLSSGRVGFGSSANGYDAYYASTGLGLALTRHLNTGVRYSFSRYRFDANVDLPTDLLFQSNRHGVNAYLSAWLPLFSRSRRP